MVLFIFCAQALRLLQSIQHQAALGGRSPILLLTVLVLLLAQAVGLYIGIQLHAAVSRFLLYSRFKFCLSLFHIGPGKLQEFRALFNLSPGVLAHGLQR